MAGRAAGGDCGGRAAQSGDHRAGAARLGPHCARFLRADRDRRDHRQFAWAADRPGLDGPPFPGLPDRAARRRGARERPGRDRHPLAPTPGRPHARLSERGGRDRGRRGRILPHRRRRLARRRRLHHLHRPRRRRVQIERLPPQPIRARERADRAHGGRRGRRRARARPDASRHRQGLCGARRKAFEPNAETAASIFKHLRERLSPYKLVRRIEFAELPKTVSGKIRRVELRQRESALAERGERAAASSGSRIFRKTRRISRAPSQDRPSSRAGRQTEGRGARALHLGERAVALGRLISSQAPLATYFQTWGS